MQDNSRAVLFALSTTQLQRLDLAFEGLPAQASLRRWARALLAPEFNRIGWSPAAGESSEVGALRAQLLTRLARFSDTGVMTGAQKRFAAALANDTCRVPRATGVARPGVGGSGVAGRRR